ncbi:tRNA splicing endonuclease subunit sen2 [Tulasnella sp. 419]|nr:tRNA splicing endonuclease subunit sen2 [Tulasnella sp. 418]KAG8958236.1 tRNA splicing endonuclease subunit sen2 [Tulasnella sp. 419]
MTSSKPRGKRQKELSVYQHLLPILISNPPSSSPPSHKWHVFASHKSNRTILSNPECVGVLDTASRSVWIINAHDTMILWQRGFFGKGTLSRSEPSWLTRHINQLNGSTQGVVTAEELTAKRRQQRMKFKAERADAMAAARAEAEAIFAATGVLPPITDLGFIPSVNKPHRPQLSTTSNTPSDPVKPSLPKSPPLHSDVPSANPAAVPEEVKVSTGTRSTEQEVVQDITIDSDLERMEHLQLTYQEAFFLAWSLGCLRILDPMTNTYLSIQNLYYSLLDSSLPFASQDQTRRWDNPFLVYYAVYHHYRSLGWVVKGGIKFCVDYLLYKKGPVFHHAEFALVVCPTYEDEEDSRTSPFELPNTQPFDWSWFSTINRVNSQVKKTLVLVYVTIPSIKRMRANNTPDGPSSPECLLQYSVREVIVRRFMPARMRD